jgi:hypothetical protein
MTGRHSVFAIHSSKWFRPPEVRAAWWRRGTTPRHALDETRPALAVFASPHANSLVYLQQRRTTP